MEKKSSMSQLKIELNLAKLSELQLSPNEYVYLYCLYHKLNPDRFYYMGSLEQRGYVKYLGDDGDLSNVSLREGAIKLFEVSNEDSMWSEFFTTFPLKVPDNKGGSRPLRSGNLETEFAKRVKPKYLGIISGKPELHKAIMASLLAEMDMRRASSSFAYMNAMEAWLNQKNWEKYAYLIDEQKNNDSRGEQEVGHGQRLV